jgi:hypothetical protein
VESVVLKLSQTLGMQFRLKIRSMLEDRLPGFTSVKTVLKAVISLRLNKGI